MADARWRDQSMEGGVRDRGHKENNDSFILHRVRLQIGYISLKPHAVHLQPIYTTKPPPFHDSKPAPMAQGGARSHYLFAFRARTATVEELIPTTARSSLKGYRCPTG